MANTTYTDAFRAAAEDFASRVKSALGDEVDAIVLYGSVARGEAGPESDIDVLIICPNTRDVRGTLNRIAYEQSSESGFTSLISDVNYDRNQVEELCRIGMPFMKNVLAEGVALYDNGTFSGARAETALAQASDAAKGIATMERSRNLAAMQLERAGEDLADARALLTRGSPRGAANRAYYAMFHAASAASSWLNVEPPRTHRGVIMPFERHCVRSGAASARPHDMLQSANRLRNRSDYDFSTLLEADEAEAVVERAGEFVAEIEALVGRNNPSR